MRRSLGWCLQPGAAAAYPEDTGQGMTGQRGSSHLHSHWNCGTLDHFRAAKRACRSPLHCSGSGGAHGGRAIQDEGSGCVSRGFSA